MEIKNAVIGKATITNGDHGCLSAWLTLDYGGSGQGFGGYNLYSGGNNSKNYAGVFIDKCLKIAGVSEWSKLEGKTIRVKSEHSGVIAIGHIVEDKWFNPKEVFSEMEKAE
jgi:hypothetical protein